VDLGELLPPTNETIIHAAPHSRKSLTVVTQNSPNIISNLLSFSLRIHPLIVSLNLSNGYRAFLPLKGVIERGGEERKRGVTYCSLVIEQLLHSCPALQRIYFAWHDNAYLELLPKIFPKDQLLTYYSSNTTGGTRQTYVLPNFLSHFSKLEEFTIDTLTGILYYFFKLIFKIYIFF
jgi:hypothetical protein